MKAGLDPDDWLLVLIAVFLWIAASARIVASIDRYSPVLSWQTAVVFGGALVVAVITYRRLRQ